MSIPFASPVSSAPTERMRLPARQRVAVREFPRVEPREREESWDGELLSLAEDLVGENETVVTGEIEPTITKERRSRATEEEKAGLIEWVRTEGVEPATKYKYELRWREWQRFVSARGDLIDEDGEPDYYLSSCGDDRERRVVLCLYLFQSLCEHDNRVAMASDALSAIRAYFHYNNVDESFSHGGLVEKCQAALRLTTAQRRTKLENDALKEIGPMIVEMQEQLRKEYWVKGSWEIPRDLTQKALYLAVCLMMDSGLRVGNVARAGGKGKEATKHNIRLRDVSFFFRPVEYPRAYEPQICLMVNGGSDLKDLVEKEKILGIAESGNCGPRYPRVEAVLVRVFSDKSARARKVERARECYMDRDNERSSVLVDDLFQWVVAASKWSQDPEASLFTREHAPLGVKGHKEITAKEVNEAIKHSAVLCNLKGRYSAKSCRTYVATVASREGMPPGELRKLGGWAKMSKVPEQYYQRVEPARGTFSFDKGEVMTLEAAKQQEDRKAMMKRGGMSEGTNSHSYSRAPEVVRERPAPACIEKAEKGPGQDAVRKPLKFQGMQGVEPRRHKK